MEPNFHKLKADISAATAELEGIKSAEWKALQEVKERFSGVKLDAATRLGNAEHALIEAISSKASHEWEGKVVEKASNSGWGYSRSTKTIKGIVCVRRVDTEFPINTTSYSKPRIGAPFVRILKSDGTPGVRFDAYLRDWKLSEDTN